MARKGIEEMISEIEIFIDNCDRVKNDQRPI